MGIFIYENVSRSVTEDEWKAVYEETLVLVKAFPLAERGTITYAGKQIVCAVPTKERKTSFRGYTKLGWCADMDYDTLNGAEEYYLPRDLINGEKVDMEAGDAMMGVLPAYLNYDWKDERFCRTYSLWDSKTQGEPYHMYLLSIACLIEDRLGEKAFVYGDITQGQCRKAVEMANQYLEKPIHIPAQCEMERLYKRIQKLPINEIEKLEVFEQFYLGVKDEGFYNFERMNFHPDAIQEYWKKRFADSYIGTRGFVQDLKKYLSAGLGLKELCSIVRMEDKEGNPQYDEFVKAVMDSKLYLKEKNTEDCLEIDQEAEQPYSIWTLAADFVFGAAHNPKANRYIPIEEIRAELKKGIGTKCDVDRYIDEYLEKEAAAPKIDVSKEDISTEDFEKMVEADASDIFTQFMNKKIDALKSLHEKYAICDYEDLLNYNKASTIAPELKEVIRKSFLFYHSMIKEKRYKELMERNHEERCAYLIKQNQQLLLRDRDWIQIFSNIEQHPETYERYYPMVRVEIDSKELNRLTTAFVLNDELYEFAEELSKEYE